MIQPGFAAIGPGGSYGSPSFGGNGNGAYDNGSNSDNGSQIHQNGVGPLEGSQGQMQPEYSLAGILHYLQSEWRRYERDRNEWEIERAEMRARVALLEGERRSIENLKTDLMRRVKMLEFALRHERSKYLASSSTSSGVTQTATAPNAMANPVNPKHAALQNQDKASTSSGRSSPAFGEGYSVADGQGQAGQRNQSTIASQNFNTINVGTINGSTMGGNANNQSALSGNNLSRHGSSAKDPKARAKSREYLKQCLQEISYLTSISTLNPLAEHSQPSSLLGPGHVRPRKTMSDNVPSTFTASGETQGLTPAALRRQRTLEKVGSIGSATGRSASGRQMLTVGETPEESDEDFAHRSEEGETQQSSSKSVDPLKSTQEVGKHPEEPASSHDEEDREKVTAIHRPTQGDLNSSDDWAKLRQAGQLEREKRERARAKVPVDAAQGGESVVPGTNRVNGADDELSVLSLNDEADEEVSRMAEETAKESQMWKSKRVLRGHLNSVRAIAFDTADLGLYSASDDGTIKYWKVDAEALKHNRPQSQATGSDSDPLATLRGHSDMVTCLAISKSKRRLFSGSADSSIVVWRLLDSSGVEPYPPFDKNAELGKLIGHTQPVWDLCIVPTHGDEDGLLVSASADGTIKIWSMADEKQAGAGADLLLTFDYFGTDPSAEKTAEKEAMLHKDGDALPSPTSVAPCMSDLRRIAVSYTNSVVKMFDVQTGKEVMQLASDEHYDGTTASQINKVVTHPTLPILISGHENNYIQFFDLTNGACTLSMVAHLDSVSSLDIDPSGLTLVSGGHDCSVRFWDIFGTQNGEGDSSSDAKKASTVVGTNGSMAVCVQEITAHRKKNTEGVLVVKYHPNATWFCSAGADGVIRIYG